MNFCEDRCVVEFVLSVYRIRIRVRLVQIILSGLQIILLGLLRLVHLIYNLVGNLRLQIV